MTARFKKGLMGNFCRADKLFIGKVGCVMDKDVGNISGLRMDLIKKYRKQIREQTYVVRSDEIAQKMAQELFVSSPFFKGPQIRGKK